MGVAQVIKLKAVHLNVLIFCHGFCRRAGMSSLVCLMECHDHSQLSALVLLCN